MIEKTKAGQKHHPLTHPQKRIYYDEKKFPGTTWAVIGFIVRYEEKLDFDLLEKAINEVILRNEGLRLRIVEFEYEHEPSQYIAPFKEQKIDFVDFSGPESERRLLEWVERNSQLPFDFLDNDLFYFAYLKYNEKESGYYMKVHHTVADGWSCFLLFSEINNTYEALKEEKNVDEVAKSSYIQYLSDEQNYLKSDEAKKDKEFWHKNLLPLPNEINLSSKPGNPDNIKANNLVIPFPDHLRTMMHEYCKTHNTSLYKLTLSAFSVYIKGVTGIDDFTVGGFNHGRSEDSYKKMVGMLVSTLPFRVKMDEELSFNQLVDKIGSDLNYIIKNHTKYPFDLLATGLREISSRDTGFLVDIAMVGHTDVKKKKFDYQYIFPGFLPNSLLMHINIDNKDKDGILEVLWCYQVQRFEESDIKGIHQVLSNILTNALANPEKKIGEIEFLSPQEKNQILYGLNKTQTEYPKDKTIHEIFEAQVEDRPDNIAIIFKDKYLTYRAFNERANQVARVLRKKGAQPDLYVGLMVERSLEMILSMLAVLKSGGAYLPIDPEYPENRIIYMLKDSKSNFLLTQGKFIGTVDFNGQFINLEEQSLYQGEKQNLEKVNLPRNLAYSIYTSGSTGNPKGVMIEHYSVINLAFSQIKSFGINEKERIFQFSSMCFDASVEQIYTALFSGAALVLIDKMTLLDMKYFEKFIDSYSLTHIHAVPLFVGSIPVKKYTNLKRVIAGGDVCPQTLIKSWIKYCDFCNEYGPTETTVTSIQLLLKKNEKFPEVFSIGKALKNTYLYVLDKSMRPVPIGVPGELLIGGDGVARGYLNRPELTAERFKANPFIKGEPMYRTGDLARWFPDGNMDFLGRIDFQVKIRGFRIETGEIENRILNQQEQKIKDAVVIAREDIAGEKYLSAYIVADETIDITSLSEVIAKDLPDYMIPAYFVQIEQIPLTTSGKLDRKALPEPDIKEKAEDYAAPRDEIEEKLVEIWSQLLHIEKEVMGIDGNFFKLGGHSLKAAVMITHIHKALEVKVLMHQIFEMPTIRKLAEYIKKEAKEEKYISITPVEEKEYYPQTSAQKRLYFIDQLQKDSVLYNIQLMDVYCKGVIKESLKAAFKKLIYCHESLRTSFFTLDGKALQRVHEYEKVATHFEFEYWETAPDGMIYSEDPGKEWTKVTGIPFNDVVEHFVRSFDITEPPLIRVGLIKIWGNTQILMLDMHHIISDGVSNVTLIKDLWALYDGEDLPELKIQYKDFSEWMNSNAQLAEVKKLEKFWLKEFAGEIPILNLPTDYPRPATMTFTGDMLHFEIGEEETHKLNNMAREQGITLYLVLFGLFNILLAKLSGQEEVIVGTVTAGRGHADLQPIIGMFVDTLAVRNYPGSEKTFKVFLKEVKEKVLTVFENQAYPFEQLVRKVAVRKDKSRNPLFDVLFTLDNEAERSDEYLLDVLMLDRSNPYMIKRAKFDMTLMGAETEESLQFNLEYNIQLFKEKTIERFIRYLKKIITSVCSGIEQKIAEIDIIPDLERGIVLYSFNDTESEYPKNQTINELFEEIVAKYPNKTALVGMSHGAWGTQLSYRDLNARINQLARLLRAKGIKRDDIAAIMIDPCQEMIIGMMGILKAGGAFLPIDHKIPKDRKEYILEESGSNFLLSREEWLAGIKYKGEIIRLDNPGLDNGEKENPLNLNTCFDLAYIIYTSGSTGKPKGVMIQHRSLINLCFWHNIYYLVTSRDCATKYAGFGFDASIWEVFPYLIIGAALYIVPEEIKLDIQKLNQYFEDNRITVSFLPTQLCEQFMTLENTSLRVLLTGGDKLKSFTKKKYHLYNNYGPTENTVVATSYLVTKFTNNIPIGKPLDNNQVYILDKNDHLQPIGVPGELCIGGDSLARGYLNNPQLSREKFIDSPFKHLTPWAYYPKVYRTGDLARWLTDGNVEFLGRIDYQVKIRGFRIELGEIVNQLLRVEHVKEAVVIPREDASGQKYLCAYFFSAKKVNTSSIKQSLAKNLPEYMIPSYFVHLDKMPLNPSGKIDTKALPAPEIKGVEYAAPTNDTEKMMTKIWSEILGIEKVGIDDNFFEIGGDSIKTILISGRLKKHNLSINVNDFFLNPTIRRLATHVQKVKRVIDQGIITGVVQLTPIQRWFFERNFKDKHLFNHVVTVKSRERLEEGIVRKVFMKILEHHDALRMIFEIDKNSGKIRQTNRGLEEGKLFDLQIIDFRDKEIIDKEFETEEYKIKIGIDLETGPLVKLGLFKTNQGDHLLIVSHHAVVDGISWRVLLEDLEIGYEMVERGEEIKFPNKTDSFKYWAYQLKEYANRAKALSELNYWKKIEETEVEIIPKDHKVEKEVKVFKNRDVLFMNLDKGETEKLLKEVNWVYNTEINDILLTALGMALNEWKGIEKVLINLEGHGREGIIEEIDISRTVGWFTSQYPLLIDMKPLDAVDELAERIKQVKEMLRQVPHKGIGYGILRYLSSKEKTGDTIFKLHPEISFNYHGQLQVGGNEHNLNKKFQWNLGDYISPEFDMDYAIDIVGMVNDEGLIMALGYNKYEYKKSSIEKFANSYKVNLLKIINHCVAKKKGILELGISALEYHIKKDDERYMEQIKQEKWPKLNDARDYKYVLLTGGTGFLGAHMVSELLKNTSATLFLPVRGGTQFESEERIKRKMAFYFGDDFYNQYQSRMVIIRADLGENQLGMTEAEYKRLAKKVEAIVHPAANVKHHGLYEELYKDNVMGTEHLLELAAFEKKKDFHYISTIDVGHGDIPGKEYNVFTEYCHDVGQKTGQIYLRSKFEAEKRVLAYREKGLNASIYRVGNLIFHSDTGKFQENIEDDYFYAIIRGAVKLEMLTENMKKIVFDMSLIDYVARALVLLLTRKQLKNETYHIANPNKLPMLDLAELLKELGFVLNHVKPEDVQEYLSQFEGNSKYEKIIELLKLHSWIFEEHMATQTVYKIDRTVILLEKLDFRWPKITKTHIEKMVMHCKQVGFF